MKYLKTYNENNQEFEGIVITNIPTDIETIIGIFTLLYTDYKLGGDDDALTPEEIRAELSEAEVKDEILSEDEFTISINFEEENGKTDGYSMTEYRKEEKEDAFIGFEIITLKDWIERQHNITLEEYLNANKLGLL